MQLLRKKKNTKKKTVIFETPYSRSVDIDTNDDIDKINYYLKKMKNLKPLINYRNIFSLKKKVIIIFGGAGNLGKSFSKV